MGLSLTFTPELCEKSVDFLRPPPPGLQSLRWGRTIEDPNTLIWILNWDSVKAHEDFMEASVYPTFVATIKAFCTAPISLFHTHLQPFPPTKIFQAGIIELSVKAKKPEASRDLLETKIDQLLGFAQKAPGYHSHFQGVKHEDDNVYVSLVGWDSVESHGATVSDQVMNQPRAAAADLIVPEESYEYHLRLQPE